MRGEPGSLYPACRHIRLSLEVECPLSGRMLAALWLLAGLPLPTQILLPREGWVYTRLPALLHLSLPCW